MLFSNLPELYISKDLKILIQKENFSFKKSNSYTVDSAFTAIIIFYEIQLLGCIYVNDRYNFSNSKNDISYK